MRCDVQHARARELALAWKSELGGEPGQWRSFSQGVSVPDYETFSRLSDNSSFSRKKRKFTARMIALRLCWSQV
jgi:hypothetical protein